MQNLITPATQTSAPAQAQTATDTTTGQPAEPFDSILARQLAGQAKPEESGTDGTDQSDSRKADEILIIGASKEDSVEPGIPVPDGASPLPGEMLAAAALLPGMVAQSAANPGQTTAVAGPHDQMQTTAKGKASQAIAAAGPATASPANVVSSGKDKGLGAALEILSAHISSKGRPAPRNDSADQPNATAQAGLLQTSSTHNTNTNTTIQTAISTPLTHDTWADEFSQKIIWLTSQNIHSAELHLNPPHLGPLDVLIKVNGDQATALFSSPHSAVRDSIEQALPKLREMLADNGIMLGNATVSDQSTRQQQAEQPGKQQKNGVLLMADEPLSAAGIQSGGLPRSGRHLGMVDTFA